MLAGNDRPFDGVMVMRGRMGECVLMGGEDRTVWDFAEGADVRGHFF